MIHKILKFEHKSQPVLPRHLWLKRVYKSLYLGLLIDVVALGIGIIGYHLLGHLGWLDALLEASMILGGMGPVAAMANAGVKLFASFYSLFSGLVILTSSGIILAPWLHRLMHLIHADTKD